MSQLVIIFGLNIHRPSLASTVRPRKIVKLFNQLLGRFRGNNQQCSAALCNMYCRVEYRGNMKSSKYLEIIIVLFNNTVLLSSSEEDQPLPACCSQGAHHANAWLSSSPPLPHPPTSSSTPQSTVRHRGHEPGVWEVIITHHGCIAQTHSPLNLSTLKETKSFVFTWWALLFKQKALDSWRYLKILKRWQSGEFPCYIPVLRPLMLGVWSWSEVYQGSGYKGYKRPTPSH